MVFFYTIWIAIQIIVGYNLVLPFILYLIWTMKKPFIPSDNHSDVEIDYAIIVTAYQQTAMLPVVVESILKLNYSNYLIYVVADNCDTQNLYFDNERVILLSPPEVLASNTASHFYAINSFLRPHERLTIIDSDNLVHPEYLNEMNLIFSEGFHAVQGLREAKNLNSIYSCLDAARDIYYHFYDGKILFELNSSATLSGSGMAFTTDLYKSCLNHRIIKGAGFDKVLQYEILKRNERIAFAPKAIVKDEKTAETDQLVNQRSRWINTWFKYFYLGFSLVLIGVKNYSWNQFLFGIVLLRPPLFVFLLSSIFFMGIDFFIEPMHALFWFIALVCFILGFFIALIKSKADEKIYRSLIGIPSFIFYQIKALLYAKNANKRSISTIHKGVNQN